MADPVTPTAPPAAEPWLARAERILRGDIHPDDYLTVTPEVRRLTDREMAYGRERLARHSPGAEPEVEVRQLRGNLLLVHCRRQHIAYIEDAVGVPVLATGLDGIETLLHRVSGELWDGRVKIDYPDDTVALL